jgi:hypothetical protein
MILLLFCLFGGVRGHMGISGMGASNQKSRDTAKGDAYRYPNAGHCHGIPAGARTTYSMGDVVTFTLSGGAAHNGGHCAIFLADANGENVWHKQMDEADCTTKASFSWTIDASLVPGACATGCTVIWAWTPTSSGACEIYMNCFDVIITGATNGGSSVTVPKNPACQRVAGTPKWTPTYGAVCSPTTKCAAAAGAGAPTAAGATTAPTPAAVVPAQIPFRCGPTWPEANANCFGSTTDGDCSTAGHGCYADMTIPCTQLTMAPTGTPGQGQTAPPTLPPTTIPNTQCTVTPIFSGIAGMANWCQSNCPGVCPASHCVCGGNAKFTNPNTGVYVPDCQSYVSKATDTFLKISDEYDLAAYQAGNLTDATKRAAAMGLLTYNQKCNAYFANDVATIDTTLTAGQNVYLTGDCEMTSICTNIPGDSAATTNYLSSFSAILITLCLAIM